MKDKGALVIFVKTPEISPVKTRLATTIGEDLAVQFYKLSIKATRAVLKRVKKELPSLSIYWAVAEQESVSNELWQDFSIIFQGDGDLGSRLDYTYRTLLEKHSFVCFMGADSPHIGLQSIIRAVRLTEANLKEGFVIGETEDGGFYFYGGAKELPDDVWLNIEYSSNKTSQQFQAGLRKYAGVELIQKSFDIDTYADLDKLGKVTKDQLVEEQIELIQWAQSFK